MPAELACPFGFAELEGHGLIEVEKPEGVKFQVSLSQEKGIRFQFPVNVSPTYRERYLRLVARIVGFWKAEIEHAGMNKDPSLNESPLKWWQLTQVVAYRQAGTIERIGLTFLNDKNHNQ